jgi:hypothetical protein
LSIGQALDGGELLLWSCDAGGGEDGVAFIEALARATGANVAASAGPIGSIAHGGHWQLDVGSAAIRSVAPLTAMGIAAYPGIMAIKIKDATIGSISTDTGSSSTDFVTDDTGPSFSGLVNTVGSGASDTLDIFLVGGVFGTGNGTLIGTVPISASGAWSFNLAASRVVAARTLTDGTYTIRLAEGGPPSKTLASQSLVIDTTAPSAPSTPQVVAASDSGISSTDNITTVTTPTFTGAAEANSRVTLFDGTTPVGSATANGSGNWSITSTVLAQGTHQITAKAADTAGNLSVASVALSVMIDTIAPAMTAGLVSDTGASESDKITSNPALSGSGDPNAVVHFTIDGSPIADTATAGASGVWTFAPTGLADGAHTIIASETDAAGNTGSASLSFALDTMIATPTVTLSDDSGSSPSDLMTNDAALIFSAAALDVTRSFSMDGGAASPFYVAPAANGSADGSHKVVVSDTDTAGNTASASITYTLDTIAPAMTAGLVSDTGASESDKITSNPGLSGSGDPNAVVHFTIDGSPIADTATAGASGVWTFAPTGLADGAHTIIASETDAAGNTGSASLSFTLDTRSPTISFAPISGDNIVDAAEAAAGFTISGVAADTNVDGQTVTIAIVDASDTLHTSYTATVAAGGGWSIDVTPAQAQALASGDYTVKGDVADVAGNPAVEATLAITVEKPAQPYTALDAPDAIETYANGINNTGDVTGYYFDNNGTHGFLYGGIGYTTLDAPDGFQTYALSVNDTGEVAGYYFDSVGTHGFLYNGGGYITLNAPASSQTYAQAINGAGEVAGYYQVDDVTHGFLYADGVFTTLDAAGSTQTYALAVNATGEVAGYYYQDGDAHGFLFDGAGFTTLDVPDSSQTYALSVNATGEVAGYYQDGAGTHGFIYDNGTYIPLNFPGSSQTYAQAINATGEVAGYYQDGAATHGFLYDGGVYTNVEAPGSLWSVAQALNDTGEVAGYYSTPPIISFLFSGGAYATLDVPGSTGTYAQAINGTGEIAGFYGDSTGTHGFLYAGGASTTLDAPNSSQTYAQAISGTGKVAGYNFDGGKYHGFLYDGGVYTPLDVSGSTGTYAQAVNDTGEVAGYYFNGGKSHGFLYDGATCTPLDVSGSTYTIAQAINDGGEVVGTYGDSGGTHSFRYDGGAYATLNVSGSTNTVATAINDTGEIGGYYQDGGGTHGFTFDDIGYTTLDVPNSSATYIQAINDAGSVAGYYFDAAGQRHGFVYDGSSYTTVNGPSASNGTYALGISDTGEVAGYYRPQQLTHGFVAAPTG